MPTPEPQRRAVGRRRTPLIFLILFIISGGATATYIIWPRDPHAAFQTVPVTRGDIEATVTAIGKIQPANYVDVGAQVSGQLTRLLVQPGDRVASGDLLAEIDARIQAARVDADRAELARLTADLDAARAEADFAGGEFKRQQQLRRDNATRADIFAQARRDMRVADANVVSLEARIEQARSTLKADEAQLGYTRIYAPMAGTVVSVEAREGQTLNATYETPKILRIADLSTVSVRTEVSEADIGRIEPAMTARFSTLGEIGKPAPRYWRGTVRQILPAPPAAEGGTDTADTSATKAVMYTVLFDVDNSDGELMPEMTAQVSFVTAHATNVLSAPLAALQVEPDDPGAYRVRILHADGHIEKRPVRTGLRDRHHAEITSGLEESDLLVTGEASASGGFSWLTW